MATPQISVIIRARDEARSIGRCLQLIGGQNTGGREVEVIVVDSGSRDQTVAIAAAGGAEVVKMPSPQFSFGGALNLGASRARGEILVALSAHAFAPDRGWLSRLLAPFSDRRVACASGQLYCPDGTRLTTILEQDISLARRDHQWGYSNAAGAFRAALWRERPFREDLPGCEDLEWSWYWLERGHLCLLDPSLVVDHDHTHDPLLSIYRRARREAEGMAMFLELPPYPARELLSTWWTDLRFYDSSLRARLSHRRAARLLGSYSGSRRGRRAATATVAARARTPTA